MILRGGKAANYDAQSVQQTSEEMEANGVAPMIMIDVSHANSDKDYRRQPIVIENVCEQVAAGDHRIMGVMVESHLVAGRQDLVEGQPLTYGQSITDGCIGWDDTELVLNQLAEAVKARRAKQ